MKSRYSLTTNPKILIGFSIFWLQNRRNDCLDYKGRSAEKINIINRWVFSIDRFWKTYLTIFVWIFRNIKRLAPIDYVKTCIDRLAYRIRFRPIIKRFAERIVSATRRNNTKNNEYKKDVIFSFHINRYITLSGLSIK